MLLILLTSCGRTGPKALHPIALQPLAWADTADLKALQTDIAATFHRPVIIRAPLDIPQRFLNTTKGERYSADSILAWLPKDQLTVAVTHKDVYTAKKGVTPVWGVLGLGLCPGNACVVSDARFHNGALYTHRLRTIVFHEIGHNLGLPHCPHPHCIMNDAEGRIATVDSCGETFCADCRRKLGL